MRTFESIFPRLCVVRNPIPKVQMWERDRGEEGRKKSDIHLQIRGKRNKWPDPNTGHDENRAMQKLQKPPKLGETCALSDSTYKYPTSILVKVSQKLTRSPPATNLIIRYRLRVNLIRVIATQIVFALLVKSLLRASVLSAIRAWRETIWTPRGVGLGLYQSMYITLFPYRCWARNRGTRRRQ